MSRSASVSGLTFFCRSSTILGRYASTNRERDTLSAERSAFSISTVWLSMSVTGMVLQQVPSVCEYVDSGLFVRSIDTQSYRSRFFVTACLGSVCLQASFSFARESF